MNAADAIELLTSNELSPSTIHLLALERLAQGVEWIDANEAAALVDTIVAAYTQAVPTRVAPSSPER